MQDRFPACSSSSAVVTYCCPRVPRYLAIFTRSAATSTQNHLRSVATNGVQERAVIRKMLLLRWMRATTYSVLLFAFALFWLFQRLNKHFSIIDSIILKLNMNESESKACRAGLRVWVSVALMCRYCCFCCKLCTQAPAVQMKKTKKL